MEEAKTEKHKGLGGKLSVYGEEKESPPESIWLKQEDVAMTEDEGHRSEWQVAHSADGDHLGDEGRPEKYGSRWVWFWPCWVMLKCTRDGCRDD